MLQVMSFSGWFYIKLSKKQNLIILAIYVDDVILEYNRHDIEEINALKHNLLNRFRGKDLGSIDEILGVKVIRDQQAKTLKLCQRQFIIRMLKGFNMESCNADDYSAFRKQFWFCRFGFVVFDLVDIVIKSMLSKLHH